MDDHLKWTTDTTTVQLQVATPHSCHILYQRNFSVWWLWGWVKHKGLYLPAWK